MKRFKDVHTEHCCQIHGCKYRWMTVDEKCTVTMLQAPQSFPCEWCLDDEELEQAYEQNEMFNRGVMWAINRHIMNV
jgi:hypothetical protein